MTDAPTNGQKVTELTLDSGETVLVKPLSVVVGIALSRKSEEVYPYPDPKPYEVKIDDSKTIEPGQVIPASQNPVYQELCQAVDSDRQRWQTQQAILLSLEPLTTRAEVIQRYADDIAAKRAILDGEVPEDAWQATVLFAVISSNEDYNRVTQAISGQMFVTFEEVRGAWRIFRPTVSGKAALGRAGKPGAPAVAVDEPRQT